MHLLIVDDDPVHRMVISRLGKAVGLDVDIASTLEEAMAMLPSKTYGCVTLDLKLGRDHGIVLLGEIASLPESPAIVVISSSSTADRQLVLEAGRQKGLNLIDVPKPIDLGFLRETLVELQARV